MRMGEFPSLDDYDCFVGIPNSSFLVSTRKTKTLDYKNIPCCCVVFPFLFRFLLRLHSFLPSECPSSCWSTTSFVIWTESCLHSVPAVMNTFQPVSHPWMNMTVLLKNLKFYVHFYFIFLVNSFFLSCRGGDASHKTRMYNDKGKNKLLLCIIM